MFKTAFKKALIPLLLLFALFTVMVANFYFLHKELNDFYSLVVKEEVERVKSVVEGTVSAGGDPVEALSIYLQRPKLLKGASFFIGGREILVPGSSVSSNYYQTTVEVKPFKFRLYIDTSYIKELNRHVKVLFVSLLFFTLLFLALTFYLIKEYYSEVLALERERKERERIASINLVIHSILHEVKNKLNVMKLLLYKLKGECSSPYLEKLNSELEALALYVEETADLRRPLQLSLQTFNPCDLIEDALGRLKPLLDREKIEVEVECSPSEVEWDYRRTLSALVDLIKNGVEALSELRGNGKLKVVAKEEGDYYLIEVRDSGDKLPSQGLFKPFATTKRKGFGLGLFNVKRVVEAHGGTVRAFVEGGWTVFQLRLPKKVGKVSE